MSGPLLGQIGSHTQMDGEGIMTRMVVQSCAEPAFMEWLFRTAEKRIVAKRTTGRMKEEKQAGWLDVLLIQQL